MLKTKGFDKGINLGGWLSQCDYSEERLSEFITEKDFETIASWGFDHVRIPIDYNILENEDGSFCDSGFARIDWALEMCRKYGLRTVLDLHKTAGYSFDSYGESEAGFFESGALQERFYRLWEEIARHYGSTPETVAFELLNEVTDKGYIDAWNSIADACIRRIRAIAPDTLILVGSYHNNSAPAVPALDPPFDDKVMYNFHCYEPLRFTHQGAYWTDDIDPAVRLSFAESGITEDFFEALFAPAIAAAEKYGTSLYCGEYGVIDIVSPEDTVQWYRVIGNVLRKHGIARCCWSYKEMDFGLSDSRLDAVRAELIECL
ncbi:MAG: glycoside hydrolase family 5 protein [Oscillospiraceae bacterium]|nr:glycoside hydrolase family 5 protein [Oscillospiraceae bacterium]